MFIYASSLGISRALGGELRLDVRSGFVRDSYRRCYQLDQFNIKTEEATATECFMGTPGRLRRFATRAFPKWALVFGVRYIYEPDCRRFCKEVLEKKDASITYLEGYWQSESYFSSVRGELRATLVPRVAFPACVIDEARLIRSQKLVGVGVRRFQEVESATADSYRLAETFYLEAIRYLKQHLPHCRIAWFSEDRVWLEQSNLIKKGDYVVQKKEGAWAAMADMWLFSICSHRILANSTYFWWGNWLRACEESITVVPKIGFPNRDCIPEHWKAVVV